MQTRQSFGQYYPVYSSVHKLNPIVKLLCFISFIFLVIFSKDTSVWILQTTIVLFLIFMSKVPFRFYTNMVFKLRYILIILLFVLPQMGINLNDAIVIFLKIIDSLLYLLLLTYTTTTSQMNYSIEKTLNVFNILCLPLGYVSSLITSIIRYIPLLLGTQNRILESASSRGVNYNHAGLFGRFYARTYALFRSFSVTKVRNRQIKEVMKQGAYNIRKYRTNVRISNIGLFDIILLLFSLALIVLYLKLRKII